MKTELKWLTIQSAPKDGSEVIVLFDSASVEIVRLCWWNNGSAAQNNGQEDDAAIGWWSYKHSVTQEMINPRQMTPIAWMPMPAFYGEERSGEPTAS